MNPFTRQTTHEHLIRDTIDTILTRTEREVDAVIPPSISKDTRMAILDELLPHARFVLESLGIEQLKNERAIEQHVANTVSTALYFVGRILKSDPAINPAESMCAECGGTGSSDLFEDVPCQCCGGTGITAATK